MTLSVCVNCEANFCGGTGGLEGMTTCQHPGFESLGRESQKGISSALYVSRYSGLRIILNQCPSPVVSTCIIVPTLGTNDEGEPHCLEHLVFRGSRNYPVGYMDTAAQHYISEGTNAYTTTDRTVYLVNTAGEEGAALMIPVFLDHVFYPLLTQIDFDTEVFHINEENENSGVVYSEMETAYSSPEQIIYNTLQKACYDETCPYRHETGGMPAVIPSLTLEKVRKVHHRYYTPSMVTLMLNGQFNDDTILAAIKSFELTLDNTHLSRKNEIPPKVAEPKLLPASDNIVFFNHDQDEGDGYLVLAFRGPDYNDINERLAMEMIGTYLCEGTAAPLVRHIVECESEEALAADIAYNQVEYRWPICTFQFEDCTTEAIREIKSRFHAVVDSIINDGKLAQFDASRMQTLIKKRSWEDRVAFESDPHTQLEGLLSPWAVNCWDSQVTIKEQIFSDSIFAKLLEAEDTFWKGLMRKYLQRNCYSVTALPSTLKKIEKIITLERVKSKSRKILKKSDIKGYETKRNQSLMQYLSVNKIHDPDPTLIKLILGKAYMHGDEWKYKGQMDTFSNPSYFVDMLCQDDKGELQFESEFIDLSLLIPVPDDIIKCDLLSLCKKGKDQECLEADISEFLNDLQQMDFEASFKKRQEAIQREYEAYGKLKDVKKSESGLDRKKSNDVTKEDDAEDTSSSSSEQGDLDFELSYCLKFVLENFKAGKLLNLIAKSIFNNDLRIPKDIAIKLGFEFEREDVDSVGFVLIDHTQLNEKLNEWAVEFDCEQGLGSSAVFENVMHVNWKVKRELFPESLLLLRSVLDYTIFDEERLIVAIRRELAGIASDLRSGSGVIPGVLWLDRYNFHSIPLLCNRLTRNIIDRVVLKYPELFTFILKRLYARVSTVLFSSQTWISLTGNSDFIFKESSSFDTFKKVFKEYFQTSSTAIIQPLVTPLWKYRHPELYTSLSIFSIASNVIETGFIHLCVSVPDNMFPPELVALDNFEIWRAVELVVASEFLRLTEGPIFKPVRESGTCYAPRFNFSLDQKSMALLLDDSIKPVEAFNIALSSLRNVLSNTQAILRGQEVTGDMMYPTEEQFAQAKAATVHSYVDELTTPIAAADASLDSWMRRLPKYIEIELLRMIGTELSYQGFLRCLERLLSHFFEQVEKGCCQIICHYPAHVAPEITSCLKELLVKVSEKDLKPKGFHETIADTLIYRGTNGSLKAANAPFLREALIKVMQARLTDLNDALSSDDDASDDETSDSSSYSEEGLAY